jgi:hypothetical protein
MGIRGAKNGKPVQKRIKGASKRGERDGISVLIANLKANKIEFYKDGDFEIKFSPLAFIPDIVNPTQKNDDENELLFYSVQGARQ